LAWIPPLAQTDPLEECTQTVTKTSSHHNYPNVKSLSNMGSKKECTWDDFGMEKESWLSDEERSVGAGRERKRWMLRWGGFVVHGNVRERNGVWITSWQEFMNLVVVVIAYSNFFDVCLFFQQGKEDDDDEKWLCHGCFEAWALRFKRVVTKKTVEGDNDRHMIKFDTAKKNTPRF